ncbi:MAG: peptidylprolyl isomerase [Hydrococcus sp. Prado102]|jgi:parvulin-like peptidyl-prolyl isomerase|nr:peptidylprolyl isomerase [Hydrococcus sp. Prado102]
MTNNSETVISTELPLVTDADIITYLRRSHKIAELTALTKRDALVIATCEQLNIKVSDEELQAEGNTFRQEHKLLSVSETISWLSRQNITVEDWSQGIRIQLLTQKLKKHLFGDAVDAHYMNNRDAYRRVALSQIQVKELEKALEIDRLLREEKASFCALALKYSQAKQSKQNGGFVGIRFVAELMPEIAGAIDSLEEGAIASPIPTKHGYHIIKIEKWFPTELTELVRDEILESLFLNWNSQRVAE